MAAYELRFKSSALRELKRLPERDVRRIAGQVELLREQPRPRGGKKLRLGKNLWRLRVGDFRVVYEIDDEEQIIRIVRVRHRSKIYR